MNQPREARPVPDWLLAEASVIPVSVLGGPVRVMSASQVSVVTQRLSEGRCLNLASLAHGSATRRPATSTMTV